MSSEQQSGSRPAFSRRPDEVHRRSWSPATVIAAAVVVLLIAALVFADPLLDGIVKPGLTDAVNGDGRRLTIGRMEYELFGNALVCRDVVFSMRDTTGSGVRDIAVRAGRVHVADVNWLVLLFGGGMALGELRVESPRCTVAVDTTVVDTTVQATAAAPSDTAGGNPGSLAETLVQALPERLHPFEAQWLAVDDGEVLYRRNGGQPDSVAGLSVLLHAVHLDRQVLQEDGALWHSADIATGAVRYRLPNSLYSVRADSLRLEVSTDASLHIHALAWQPVVSDAQFYAAHTYRTERFRIAVERLHVGGIHLREYLRTGAVRTALIALHAPEIDIALNKRLPIDSAAPPPAMPHVLLASLPMPLHIDSVQVRDGRIVYSELFPYSNEPAVLPFAAVSADVAGIRHRPGVRPAGQELTLRASGRLADAGMMNLRLHLPLDTTALVLRCTGSLGAMNPQALNRFLVIADRIRITSGNVSSAGFDLNVENGRAGGVVRAVYTGLSMRVLDEETGSDAGLMPKLKTFIANAFALRRNNPPHDAEQGAISYVRKPDDAFMDVVWLSVRSGLGDLVGF